MADTLVPIDDVFNAPDNPMLLVNNMPEGLMVDGQDRWFDEQEWPAPWAQTPVPTDGACTICLDEYAATDVAVKLSQCSHVYHQACIERQFAVQPRCLLCRRFYKEPKGNQPNGSMRVTYVADAALAGLEPGAYIVNYVFPDGVQGPEHDAPGEPYTGTRRRTFFPACEQGRAIVARFMKAWDARVLFTIGTSVTTGVRNTVIWGSIHQKTNIQGGPANHGYPDSDFLRRADDELAAAGIY